MKKIFLLFATAAIQQALYAQINTTLPADSTLINLDEVIISASNFAEKKRNAAQKIETITAKKIALTNAQNTGDLLANTGKIFVQKSQQGGSSPVIRGFEASRVLLVIDGVRMNNAIYRSGHLQNIITTDQNMLNRVEILYGPSSAIYGSDALGGAIHFITKGPQLSADNKTLVTGSGFARYSSANTEKTVHADVSIGSRRFAWFQSYNFSDFGDMKMGNQYPDKYPDFGRRENYVTTINGADTVMNNSDDRVQKFSGYKQWDFVEKFLFKQNHKIAHLLNLQLSNTGNVPRYDRLQDIRNGTLRYAQWYYGPQTRWLGAYELSVTKALFFDELKVNINYQDITESRQTRDFKRYDRFDSRREKVNVWGATFSGRKLMGNDEITAGLDAQLNDVKSRADRTNLLTGAVSKLDTRYPDGKNKMNSFALFAQHIHKFRNEKMVLNDGIRLQMVRLKSNIADNSFFNLPQTAVKQNNIAVTGNLGLVFTPQKNTIIKTNLSSGFRAPNIDDLAKVFESSTQARQVVLPNADLKPEYTYNLDLTINQHFTKKINVEITGFYTWFRNAIVKAPFQLNGQDSIDYNGVKSQVLASQNVNKAALFGITADITAAITNELVFSTTLSYTKGEYKTDPSKKWDVYEKQPDGTYKIVSKNISKRPLDHIPPVIGRTGLTYSSKWINTELYFLYNGWKKLDGYNTDGEDNAQYATASGMPSWLTINWRATVNATKKVQVQLGVENILNRNYRYFASGFSSPGRNFIVTVRSNW